MEIPKIGLGTWQMRQGKETENAVKAAIDAGYRLIDTARIYNNEFSVGQAVKDSGVKRSELFVTTKLWTSDFGYANAMTAFAESLERLGLEYVDLYLIHWPGADQSKRHEAWRGLIELGGQGSSKHIGVSNFDRDQLQALMDDSQEKPYVNQIEFHPFIYERQKPTLDFCRQQGIIVEAYSPLARSSNLSDKTLQAIAGKYNKSTAQVMLRWALQHGTVPIPKSANPERIRENLDVFDFELTEDEINAVNSLSADESVI